VKAILGTGVGHQIAAFLEQAAVAIEAIAKFKITVVGRHHAAKILQKHRIGRGLLQPILADATQKYLGIVAALFPQLAIEPEKQRAHTALPTVDQVVRELFQPLEFGWNAGLNFERETGTGHVSGASVGGKGVRGDSAPGTREYACEHPYHSSVQCKFRDTHRGDKLRQTDHADGASPERGSP
jgi:hypothetical protein